MDMILGTDVQPMFDKQQLPMHRHNFLLIFVLIGLYLRVALHHLCCIVRLFLLPLSHDEWPKHTEPMYKMSVC